MPVHKKKRNFEMGRVPAMTKMGEKRVRYIRTRGGTIIILNLIGQLIQRILFLIELY